MSWVHFYSFKRKLMVLSSAVAMLTACAGADDLAVSEPEQQAPKAGNSQVKAPTSNPVSYSALQIDMIQPEAIFPQIKQIEAWDPKIYEYVEDLRVAEAYVMRDMMWKYGTGKYSPEEYQKLLSRVTMGLIEEIPDNYQDYPRIWPTPTSVNITDHGICAFKNLINLKGEFTNIKNLANLGGGWGKNLLEYAKEHPDDIFIFSSSATKTAYSQNEYKTNVFDQNIIDLCNLPNVIIFVSWGDTKTVNWENLKIIYNGDYNEVKWNWRYLYSSMANSDKNNYPSSNMRIVIWNHPSGNVDISNSEWSLFPYWFNNNVTISGHPILPIFRNWRFRGEDYAARWWYFSSYVAPTTASEVQLMFGLRADVTDANELLQMIEGSLADPDYISLNGEKQALQKYSPANFIKKYLMPENLPTEVKSNETVALEKGYYKGIIFNIPGAEVLVDGEWIACTQQNAEKIKAQNPFNLEWRLNGDLCKQLGYENKTVEGTIILVDDQYNGLNITVPISITVKNDATGIRPVYAD